MGECVNFLYSYGFDLFGQYSFEEKFVAIGDEIDGFIVEIQIVVAIYLTKNLKQNIKTRGIDDQGIG